MPINSSSRLANIPSPFPSESQRKHREAGCSIDEDSCVTSDFVVRNLGSEGGSMEWQDGWVSWLLNEVEDGVVVACSTTHQQRSENAERGRGVAQVAPAFVMKKKKI